MPKSRKKRNEHKDFQKVKFKVGKTLKKADNVTNPTFHSRTIHVTQKIKSTAQTEPSSKRKLNVSELLNQFQHYSSSTRVDAVIGLRELLSSHSEVLIPNLVTILERTAQLFVDKDPVVRQSVHKLLKVIFSSLTEKHLAPFFMVVSAHLCCAMTHIYDDIQSDSLHVLDLLLEHFPKLIASHSQQILLNFYEQISKCRLSGNSNAAKTASSNLKMASHKWRAKVLSRLHKLLIAIFAETKKTHDVDDRSHGCQVKWSHEEKIQVQPFPIHFHAIWKNPGFTFRSSVNHAAKIDRTVSLNDEGGFKKFVQLIMPLLIECWIESSAISAMQGKGSDNLVTMDSLPLRSSVANVLQLLCQFSADKFPASLTGHGWFSRLYNSDMKGHLLRSFPYTVHVPAKKQGQNNRQQVEDTMKNINISICDIMTHFHGDEKKWETTLVYFLEDVINDESQDKQQMKMVTDIASRIVKIDSGVDLEKLLDVMLKKYIRSHPLSTDKRLLSQFFSEMVLDRKHQQKISADIMDTFMTSLPDLFISVANNNHQVAALILQVMKTAACQNCWILLQQLNKFICKITGDNTSLLITADIALQKSIMELVLYVPQLQKSTLKSFANLVRRTDFPLDSSLYLLQIIHQKYIRMSRTTENAADYISFMLSTILESGSGINHLQPFYYTPTGKRGVYIAKTLSVQYNILASTEGIDFKFCRQLINHDGTNSFSEEESNVYDIPKDCDKIFFMESLLWEQNIKLTEAVSLHLVQYGNTEHIVEIIFNFIMCQKLSESQIIPVILLSNRMEFNNYPISTRLTDTIISKFRDYFCKVMFTKYALSGHMFDLFSTRCSSVIERLVGPICQLDGGLKKLLHLQMMHLKGAERDIEKLQKICSEEMLWMCHYDNLVQSSKVKDVPSSCISATAKAIQDLQPDLKEQQWWTDFTFLANRLKL